MSRSTQGLQQRGLTREEPEQQGREQRNLNPSNNGRGQNIQDPNRRSVPIPPSGQLARQVTSSVATCTPSVIASSTISVTSTSSPLTTSFGTSACHTLPSVMPVLHPVEIRGSWAEEMEADSAATGRGPNHPLPQSSTQGTSAVHRTDEEPQLVNTERTGSPNAASTQPSSPIQLPETSQQLDEQADREIWREAIFRNNQKHYNELLTLILVKQQHTSGTRTSTPPPIPHTSTTAIDPRSTDELTASQFRTVLHYISTNNVLRDEIAGLRVLPRESTPARDEDYVAAAHIVELLQSIQKLGAATIQSFHNVATSLARNHPFKFRYCTLMGWIHELSHGITAISVHTNQLSEIALPKLLDWANNQNYFRATLQIFRITEFSLRETLQFASAVSAHATRMIRVLEAHQLLHALHHQLLPATDADKQYAIETLPGMPEPISADPNSFLEVLQWWRSNYAEALMITTTEGYLRTQEMDRMEKEEKQAAHTPPPEQQEENIEQVPTETSGSTTHEEQQEELVQPSSPPRTSPPTPGPRATTAVEAPVLFPRTTSQEDNTSPSQPPPKRSCTAPESQQAQQLADTGLQRIPSWLTIRSSASTPESDYDSPWEIPPPIPPPESTVQCVFCDSLNHYTSDCPRIKRLSQRVQFAIDYQLCINCLKHHRGQCVRFDPCSKCKRKGHHRTFCLDNPYAIPDIHESRTAYYTRIAEQTFRPYPDPMEDRPQHQQTLKEALARKQAQQQARASSSRPSSSRSLPLVRREVSSHEDGRPWRHRTEEADDSDNGSW
ncbi:unnamed protein product [Heligmosomoides polygyrus]|uniref:CCHC-type domain-containing protein n=1 Tax=Heligmosomoides polygyrus TaxID=6339 RepID=A0A183GS37_HELPZ|nr:unnamed protein product [Heligmosomoides polygyrus]